MSARCSVWSHPRILELLRVRQVAQALQIERHKERLRRHKRIRRAAARRARSGGDQLAGVQPPDQIATNTTERNA